MKKVLLSLLGVVFVSTSLVSAQSSQYSFGDFRSETIIAKAWKSLEKSDTEGVLAYTNKVIELYGEEARKMQNSQTEYAADKDAVFSLWALNDVATAYYIQAQAYTQSNMVDQAKNAYKEIIDNYSYAQIADGDSFWKPVEAAKEKVAMIESGVSLDYGDYKSQTLVTRAWSALAGNDLQAVVSYVDKALELYAKEARTMQNSLEEYPWESKEAIFNYWALNDVGTSLFILGEAYRKAGKTEEASETFRRLVDDYFYAQTWDPQGWFWKPAEAAQQKLAELDQE